MNPNATSPSLLRRLAGLLLAIGALLFCTQCQTTDPYTFHSPAPATTGPEVPGLVEASPDAGTWAVVPSLLQRSGLATG